MGKKWMPVTAGILDLVGGVSQAGFSAFFIFVLVDAIFRGGDNYIPIMMGTIIGPFILPGIMAIIGGIFTLKRRRWEIALVGSFMAFLPPVVTLCALITWDIKDLTEYIVETLLFIVIPIILGVTAPVLTILSRKQFK